MRAAFRNSCATTSPAGTENELRHSGFFAAGIIGNGGTPIPGGSRVRAISDGTTLRDGRVRIADIVDGTSNTWMFGESAGRHQVYIRGRQQRMPNAPGQVGWQLNVGYFDYNAAMGIIGFDSTGTVVNGGCCAVNCSNSGGTGEQQIYSFHPGGATMLRGDGSVHFLAENTATGIIGAMVTRNGGEATSAN
jgi:hypothetical protein